MKTLIYVITILTLFRLQVARGAEDPRFVDGTKGEMNSYLAEMKAIIPKAFGRYEGALTSFQGIKKIGGTYVIWFSVSLDNIEKAVTEKDFKRLDEFIEPFIKSQVAAIKRSGVEIYSTTSDFPLPSSAKDYTNDKLPTMVYRISGKESDLLYMKVTFSERKDNFLVVDFTVIAVP